MEKRAMRSSAGCALPPAEATPARKRQKKLSEAELGKRKKKRVYTGIYRYFTIPVYTLRNTRAAIRPVFDGLRRGGAFTRGEDEVYGAVADWLRGETVRGVVAGENGHQTDRRSCALWACASLAAALGGAVLPGTKAGCRARLGALLDDGGVREVE